MVKDYRASILNYHDASLMEMGFVAFSSVNHVAFSFVVFGRIASVTTLV